MKILFASSKEMLLENLIKKNNDINFNQVYQIIDFIKSVSYQESCTIFKTKEDIYQLNQDIDVFSKKAIELFNGIAFRQLSDRNNEKYQDLCILSALYGLSYGFDYISPFRYDYTMKDSKKYRKDIYVQINELLSKEDVVFNLASSEFSQKLKLDNMINFEFLLKDGEEYKKQSVWSKKCRGQMVNHIFKNGIDEIKEFNYESFYYDERLSDESNYVFVKDDENENK